MYYLIFSTVSINVLGLLENVFLKIGLTETDEQLEKCLSKFLCPVLLKLTSKQLGVQGKVIRFVSNTVMVKFLMKYNFNLCINRSQLGS